MQQTFFDLLGNEFNHLKTKQSNAWYWHFSDYPKTKNGLKVFSCFACGGGSTKGYKLAGYDVIGDLEIDKRMNSVYLANVTNDDLQDLCDDLVKELKSQIQELRDSELM